MTVWVLNLPLNKEEETRVAGLAELPIPLVDAPNMSSIRSLAQLKQLLLVLQPDAAPESIHTKASHMWEQYSALHKDDVVAVPLHHHKQIAVAEIVGPYFYHAEAGINLRHRMQVKWAQKRAPYRLFEKELSIPTTPFLQEVMDEKQRTSLRQVLPYSYNRFAAFKWIIVVIMVLNIIALAVRAL